VSPSLTGGFNFPEQNMNLVGGFNPLEKYESQWEG
jgi:hypothetical protein